jgi:hypothetical protein
MVPAEARIGAQELVAPRRVPNRVLQQGVVAPGGEAAVCPHRRSCDARREPGERKSPQKDGGEDLNHRGPTPQPGALAGPAGLG